ncbi:MAG: LPS-assembly protein LptD, partial [Hydrotalea flava]|nr:LPS-assembly protein LptD [Hydrotalea flava]
MNLNAFNTPPKFFFNSLTAFSDTIPTIDTTQQLGDTVVVRGKNNSSRNSKDSSGIAKTDTLQLSKDSLDAPVHYAAADSGVLLIPSKQFILYGKADAKYKDIELQAAIINYNQQSQLVRAYGLNDTSTNLDTKPKLTQGDSKSISDSILFDLKTMKGRTTNSFFNEGELFVHADVLKKEG